LAATIETVARVGPCEAEIKLVEIKDVRETKRKQIIERAAKLLKEWDNKSLESSEIEEQIDTDIKLGEIISWGPEQLPAGPEVDTSSDLVIVEGRADVLNLLRIGVKNTVAVQGTQVPKSIIDLANKKENVIAFLDGDRGGTIILNELLQVAKIDFVARAPEGYEVEELTRKQMIKCLQNKKPVNMLKDVKFKNRIQKGKKKTHIKLQKILSKIKLKDRTIIIDTLETIEPATAVGFNENLERVFTMPVRKIFKKIRNYDVKYLIIDGILTDRLLSLSINMDIKFIACRNKQENLNIPEQIAVYFF